MIQKAFTESVWSAGRDSRNVSIADVFGATCPPLISARPPLRKSDLENAPFKDFSSFLALISCFCFVGSHPQ